MQKKENIYDLAICTDEGEKHLCVKHCTEYEEDEWNVIKVKISTEIAGRSICLEGDDTEYLLYRLAKMLPTGATLKSCISCRYGNFCPIGDYDNELFCVSDFEPKQKSDLYDVTEEQSEREKRSRNLFHVCGQYIPQSEEYYTYSNYLDKVQQPTRKE